MISGFLRTGPTGAPSSAVPRVTDRGGGIHLWRRFGRLVVDSSVAWSDAHPADHK
jgi:hypothetical protein